MKFTFTRGIYSFNLEVHGRYNFITGASGTGKTFLLRCLEDAYNEDEAYTSDSTAFIPYGAYQLLRAKGEVPCGAIVYLDESIARAEDKTSMIILHEQIREDNCYLLYSIRDSVVYFEYGINDVFVLVRDGNVFYTEKAFLIPKASSSAVMQIVCEDSKSGYRAMQHKYGSAVISANGKDNIARAVMSSSNACAVYADLCGAGAALKSILDLPNAVPGTVVAPSLSFEHDALRKNAFADCRIPFGGDYPDPASTQLSEEEFYAQCLDTACRQVYTYGYRKGSRGVIDVLCDETSWLPSFNLAKLANASSEKTKTSGTEFKRMKLGG